jgi:DNA-binding FrmR family transcriptional regulator
LLVSGAIDSRQSQDGTVRKGLAPAQGQRDHHIVTAADSHPDCRAVLIQIVALYVSTNRKNRVLRALATN